ncbi:MAG: MotA/TolQ/ExbB proton channel family protein [Alphaproteobacteria bacterium]|nr:MotA/TolQ/ExbB proton channel family protein [Alphaproteobacteria bacterium]
MTDSVSVPAPSEFENVPLPNVRLQRTSFTLDFATILGVFFSLTLIAVAISMGNANANFLDVPSIIIVIFGTMAATSIAFTSTEISRAGRVIGYSMMRRSFRPGALAKTLLDLSVIAKKKGILALVNYDQELHKDAFLHHAMQMAIDGYVPEQIDRLLTHEIEALVERHKRSASICRRASEIAPAMGLIGTLVGLVQMLANLEQPEKIGPAMAVALLTTFYGAIMGTVLLAPMASKLEKNSADEALIKNLVKTTAVSIAKQENPRQLEMQLNAQLPPSERIEYFD